MIPWYISNLYLLNSFTISGVRIRRLFIFFRLSIYDNNYNTFADVKSTASDY